MAAWARSSVVLREWEVCHLIASLFALMAVLQWVSSVQLGRKMMLFLAHVNFDCYNFMGGIYEENHIDCQVRKNDYKKLGKETWSMGRNIFL